MADLILKGKLNLTGMLKLEASSGGKVKVDALEMLVVLIPPGDLNHGTAPPVLLPPPKPLDPAPKVWVVQSFNQTVTIGNKAIVAQGMVMEGSQNGAPIWPGMVLRSQNNQGPVTINQIPINVVNDQAIIFPSGGTAIFSFSGQ